MEVNGDNKPVSSLPESESTETPVDFETAVSATGYGAFNVLLLMAAIPAGWSTVFDISTIAFVMPSMECELDLNLFRKGALAAAPFAGMMCTAIIWGFIADRVGRKYLLLFGLISDALCNILGSASQSYYIYLSFKFFNGIMLGGPFAILMTYISEFHGERHRSKVLVWAGSFFALGNIAVPALARIIIPLPWSFSIFENSYVFKSWRIFLIICGLPPLLGFMTLAIFPESPKYLMTKGKSAAALRIFKTMYSMNTGKSRDNYPVKALSGAHVTTRQTPLEPTSRLSHNDGRGIFSRTKTLFAAPYLIPLFIVNTILFASMTGMHVMKSWLPQLIVILNNFDPKESDEFFNLLTVCEKLDVEAIESSFTETANTTANSTETCIPMVVSSTVYTNATIIAASATAASFLTGIIVTKIKKQSILLISLVSGGLCYLAVTWSPSTDIFLIVAAACVALLAISTNMITAMIVEIFPTSVRASIVSVTVMMGRLGALTGNLLLPVLLNVSCDTPFYYIGGSLMLSFVLAIFLPNYSGSLQ